RERTCARPWCIRGSTLRGWRVEVIVRRMHRMIVLFLVSASFGIVERSRAEEPEAPPAQRSGPDTEATPGAILARFAHEPSIAQVHAWTLRHARLDPRTLSGLWRSSRHHAALPQLTVEYRLRNGWDQD